MTEQTRIALVTGANKGLGLEIARQLAEAGHTVLLGARHPGRGEAAAAVLRGEGLDVTFIELDVLDQRRLAVAAAQIEQQHGRLDVLINNAGTRDQRDGNPGVADIGAVRRTLDTNFFGALAVTQAMLPLLKKSEAGRVVNMSSGLGSLTLGSDPNFEFAHLGAIGYRGSKAALNMLTVLLAAELRPFGIKVNSADPGYTATDLNGHRGSQTVREGAKAPLQLALLPPDGPTGGFFSAAGTEPW